MHRQLEFIIHHSKNLFLVEHNAPIYTMILIFIDSLMSY